MNSPNHSGDIWPDPEDPADYNMLAAGPIVGVPEGLLGTAVELLDVCDELFNRPGNGALGAKVAAVIRRYQPADVATLRWFHDGPCITAYDLQELLNDRGIHVDAAFRSRPTPHHR
jgi:hypothetical protein